MDLEKELEDLLSRKVQLEAMRKSSDDFEQKWAGDIKDFMAKHLGIQKGADFHLLDVIKKARNT